MTSLYRVLSLLFCVVTATFGQESNSISKSQGFTQQKVDIRNCSNINTKANEFSPAFYQNGIVFVSNRNENGARDHNINSTFFQLYYAESDRNFNPMKPVEFSFELNSERHEGPLTFSRDANTVYFTRNNERNGFSKKDATGKVRMKIFEAQRSPRDWQNIKELSFNSDDYTCFHPTLSADGRYLYFSSDMPGGYGDFDLYVTEKKGDTWSLPKNLGPKINSAKKEAFPFIHESGLLFYSSNNSGMGGFDIFVANLNTPEVNVKNIGEPFNSADDDLGFILSPNAMTGYFNSSRRLRSFGQDDIFVFQAQEPLTNETVIINTVLNIADNDTKTPISGAAIRIFERNGNSLLNNGNMFDVLIQQDKNGSSQLKLIRKETANLGDPDKYSTSNGEAKYDFKNERSYLILVSKEGYDDEEYNYSTVNKLGTSDNINILLKKPGCASLQGIVKDAINVPLAGVKVTISDGNKIVLVTQTDAKGRYTACLKGNINHAINYEKDGYNANASQSFQTGGNINKEYSTEYILAATAKKEIEKPITKGSVIVLENIYYDFNKAIIRADATKELDALANLMQRYPSMEVELVAHTDSRGKDSFNEKLSTQRALAAKNYLVASGVASSRITSRGAGESQIRNQCKDGVDCEEAQHQYNRRTEVRVTKIDDAAVEVKYGN